MRSVLHLSRYLEGFDGWPISSCARQHLLQIREEFLPSKRRALVGLLLIRPEARLLHAQKRPRARPGERPDDDTLETKRRPRVRQRLVRCDFKDLTVDSTPAT